MTTQDIQRLRLLLIEDDEADALLVERALERFPGFELRHVTRMEGAIETLSAEPFDAALLDLSLPDSFGLEGVTRLQARFPDLPVVILTGLDDSEMPLEALERGAQDYLCKGRCSPENLIRALRYSIQRQQIQSENRRLLEELAKQARHDPLTNILNRRSLVSELQREWQRSTRGSEPLSCVMIDVDFFKRINDAYGHAAGDYVLQSIANLLSTMCRSSDVPGRYGGEEFLVLLPATTEGGAMIWAERLRQELAATPIALSGDTIHVTASFGVAERTPGVEHSDQMVDQADQALGMAKQLGRDQVISYQETIAQADGTDGQMHDAFSRLTAADIMTPLVATLVETATLLQATEFLLNLQLDSAPIVDSQGKLVGILGEEKLARVLAAPKAWSRAVSEVMSTKPISFSMETPAAVIQDFLSRAASRRVVILDEQRPVGIVSRSSILRWREHQERAGRSLLANLSQDKSPPTTQYASLLALVTEIESQVARLASGLVASDDPPVDLTVAAATRIQSLLESAVTQSQRMETRHAGQATVGGIV
ncbi:MAG: diguanylate cyclase [Pirellulaceae bacterium]